eukprot:Gregarina_sp_Poly_1__70@NODE_1015_length_5360_cov_819_728887_g708_i0_p1_GENE_NODE_1015_length_5360_cov_819_728887_g708_i0NODE_1015_length_5360_cov_819_728887_g708_i0_p1_ORF_typecomplete_len555_score46_39_NODE_1015_length_5360_cov_819_728887_g708_i017333397
MARVDVKAREVKPDLNKLRARIVNRLPFACSRRNLRKTIIRIPSWKALAFLLLLCAFCANGKLISSLFLWKRTQKAINPLSDLIFNTTWRVRVHYSPDHFYDGLDMVFPRDLSDRPMFGRAPLRCNIVIFSASATMDFVENCRIQTQITRHKLEYFQRLNSTDCYLEVGPLDAHLPCFLPNPGNVRGPRWNFRPRWDFMLHLMRLMREGSITFYTPPQDNSLGSHGEQYPLIVSQDTDLIFSSLEAGYSTLNAALEKGLSLNQTLEERACLVPNNDWFECDASVQPFLNQTELPLRVKDLALVASHEAESYDIWLINAGHLILRPSRLMGFLVHSVLAVYNYTEVQGKYDHTDQGRMSFIMREVFDFDFDRIRALTVPWPGTLHKESLEVGELSYVRRLNSHRASRHPLIKEIYHFWFSEGDPPFPKLETEPNYLAITAPRLLNAPGCRNFYYTQEASGRWVQDMLWHCGDTWIHFNGCPNDAYADNWWRQQFLDIPECQKIIPFSTNDDGSVPFDLPYWIYTETLIKKDPQIFRDRPKHPSRFLGHATAMPLS